MLNLFMPHRITSVKQVARDGYNKITETTIYTDIACNFRAVSYILFSSMGSSPSVDVKIVAEVIVDSVYDLIRPGYKIEYGVTSYLVANVDNLQTPFGNIEGYKLKLKANE